MIFKSIMNVNIISFRLPPFVYPKFLYYNNNVNNTFRPMNKPKGVSLNWGEELVYGYINP